MRSSLICLVSFFRAAVLSAPAHFDLPNFMKIENADNVRIEGDMSNNEMETIRRKRAAPDSTAADKKWPLNQVISYRISSAYDKVFAQKIRNAFEFWSDNTCLTFQENGPTLPLLRMVKGRGCASSLGRVSGVSNQIIYLDDECDTVGAIVHEIAHSIGLGHTQMRSDRDSYVTINETNMQPGTMHNFRKMLPGNNNNFGVDYDYSSVMHYDDEMFAINKDVPVLVAKDANAQKSMGQREKAAFSDVKMVNLFYGCAENCPSPSVKCQNGGIINSKTCNSCMCPPMFTGFDCSQRSPAKGKYAQCGGDLTATSAWQTVQGSIESPVTYYAEDPSKCYWNIKAPEGRKIEVLMRESGLKCSRDCYWNGIDLFTKGFVNGGYKFCCAEQYADKVFQSVNNGVSIRLFSIYGTPGVDVDYRLI